MQGIIDTINISQDNALRLLHINIYLVAIGRSLGEKVKGWENVYCETMGGAPGEDEYDVSTSNKYTFPSPCSIEEYKRVMTEAATDFVDHLNLYREIIKIRWDEPIAYLNPTYTAWRFRMIVRAKK